MAEITATPDPDFDYSLTVSSGDAISDPDSELSGDSPAELEETGTDSTSAAVSGSPEYETELLALFQEVRETQALILASEQRQELQLEACISILMIFMIVGLLNYIYKFFKMFF